MSRSMSIRAFTLNNLAKQRTQHQIASLLEIVQAAPTDTGPVIPIKGLSLYALTGENDNIRMSGDIDIFAENPESVWVAMTGLGYATEEKHEEGSHFAVMHRNGEQVEIHRSFPVWTYPPSLAAADLRPASHPSLWMQPFSDLRETSIQYEDIAGEVCPGIAPKTQGLTVLNPTMAALLLCVHAFRHYVEGHALDSPIVRLCELADIHDLLHHPQFDEVRFRSLVSRFSAHDAIGFVQCFLHLHLGVAPHGESHQLELLDRDEVAGERWGAGIKPFPMLLSSWAGWIAPQSPDELLLPLNSKKVFDRLAPNLVTAGGWHCTSSCNQNEAAGTQTLSRIIVQSITREQLPVKLFACWESDTLHFDVEILRTLPKGYRYQVLVYYPYKFQGVRPAGFEVPYSNARWAEAGYDGFGNPTFSDDAGQNSVGIVPISLNEHGCEARLSFRWSDLPLTFSRARLVPMMVLVMKIRDEQPHNICFREDTLLMLPLHIILLSEPAGEEQRNEQGRSM